MPHGNHEHHHGAAAGAATVGSQSVVARPAPCAVPPIETATCCDLVCFERPRYFCGHLLKDTDLSTGQTYVIEKHKLYHRTLHGHGIVCGLRLTCDASCCGYVRIGEGYAIDDCGNDIVVCESARFDVLKRLGEKGLLVPEVPKDPCDKEHPASPCPVRQCFYIVACYQETEHEFTTPLTPACGPSPKDCQATRVRETYAFDVVDRLPARTGPLEALRERLECCFTLFTDHPFAVKLRDVRALVCQEWDRGVPIPGYDDQLKLFCELRGLLLLYIRQHPDKYNCRIEQEILDVRFPTPEELKQRIEHDAYCKLIAIAWNHVLSCLLGELAFPCAEPAQASCVVLGTVEVEEGCVVRVCNCPRRYVWSFTSFFQVLIATLLGSAACETVDAPKNRPKPKSDCGCEKGEVTQTCCKRFEIDDCCEFLTAMMDQDKRIGHGALAMLDGIEAVHQAMRRAYDPARWDYLSASAFVGLTPQEIEQHAYLKRAAIRTQHEPLHATFDPIEALTRSLPFTANDRFVLQMEQDRVVAAQPVPELAARVAQLEQELQALKKQFGGPARKAATKRPG